MKIRTVALFSIMILCAATIAVAADSPQFRGPNRDGRFADTGLMKSWPESGPAVAWVAKGLGKGYSSVAVANGKIYALGMAEDQSGSLFVINPDGSVAQKIAYGPDTPDKQAPGPRSTPTIEGNRAYFVSGLGVVYCIDLEAGKVLWEVSMPERFKAPLPQWQYAESLLVDGDNLICTPGAPNATMAALNKNTGETVWVTTGMEDTASYCSAMLVNHKGRRIILNETSNFVICVDANTGALLWKHEHPTKYEIHAVSPLYQDGIVYFAGGGGFGGGALALSDDASSVQVKWESKDLDSVHHGTVLVDGNIYGTSPELKQLVCVDATTGKSVWTSKDVKIGVVVYADGMLYIYEESGVVDLVKASPAGFERTGQFTVTEGENKHWAHPVIANGRLYIRHGDALICYDIAQK